MMTTIHLRRTNGYANPLGLRLLRQLIDEGRFIFTTDDARIVASRLGISDTSLSQVLPRLVEGGWLSRLRRGLYAGTGGLPGTLHIHPFAIATRVVTPSAISHWSAMNYHGLTEQVPRIVMACTPKKVVTPSMRNGKSKPLVKHTWEVAGIQYTYVSVRPHAFFGIEEVWVDPLFRVPITDKERTLLDGCVSPRMVGGMGEVLGILEEHVHDLDLEKLVGYALRYGKASVAKRLGWALEQEGVSPRLLTPLRALPVAGVRVLDPTRPRRGPCDPRWMIQNNLAPRSTG
jgi:predicted transcriptional regulator of viral defense system